MSAENILTVEVAKRFVADPEAVDLCEYTTLDADAAKVLCQHTGELYLDGITELSDPAAQYLSHFDGKKLSLSGLSSMTREAAIALATSAAPLELCEGEFGEEILAILASHPSFRINEYRLEAWLFEQCQFGQNDSGDNVIAEGLLEALCEAADKYTCRGSDGEWYNVSYYDPFDEGISLVKSAGNREIHIVKLLDAQRHIVVYFGPFDAVRNRLEGIIAKHA